MLVDFSGLSDQYGTDGSIEGSAEGGTDAPIGCEGGAFDCSEACGRAGHDCLGGACLAGQCLPVLLATIDAKLDKAPLALDADRAYWLDTGGIMAVEKRAGTPSTATALPLTAGKVTDIVVDTTGLYVSTDPGGVYHAPPGVTMLTPLVQLGTAGASSLALDTMFVYWTSRSDKAIGRAPKGGGTPIALVNYATFTSVIGNLVKAETELFWTNDAPRALSKASVSGCVDPQTCATVLIVDAGAVPNGLVVDDAGVFFSTRGALSRTDALGAASTTVFAATTGQIRSLAMDADAFYLGIATPSSVIRVSRTDGSVRLLAKLGSDIPQALAVDDSALYYVSTGAGGGVSRVAK